MVERGFHLRNKKLTIKGVRLSQKTLKGIENLNARTHKALIVS
jgi:hypothetical protein